MCRNVKRHCISVIADPEDEILTVSADVHAAEEEEMSLEEESQKDIDRMKENEERKKILQQLAANLTYNSST